MSSEAASDNLIQKLEPEIEQAALDMKSDDVGMHTQDMISAETSDNLIQKLEVEVEQVTLDMKSDDADVPTQDMKLAQQFFIGDPFSNILCAGQSDAPSDYTGVDGEELLRSHLVGACCVACRAAPGKRGRQMRSQARKIRLMEYQRTAEGHLLTIRDPKGNLVDVDFPASDVFPAEWHDRSTPTWSTPQTSKM